MSEWEHPVWCDSWFEISVSATAYPWRLELLCVETIGAQGVGQPFTRSSTDVVRWNVIYNQAWLKLWSLSMYQVHPVWWVHCWGDLQVPGVMKLIPKPLWVARTRVMTLSLCWKHTAYQVKCWLVRCPSLRVLGSGCGDKPNSLMPWCD